MPPSYSAWGRTGLEAGETIAPLALVLQQLGEQLDELQRVHRIARAAVGQMLPPDQIAAALDDLDQAVTFTAALAAAARAKLDALVES